MRPNYSYFPELDEIYKAAQSLNGVGEFKEEAWVEHGKYRFPLTSFKFGSEKEDVPRLVLVGGIHGLEKIGSHVIISYLQSLIRMLKWDRSLKSLLKQCQLHIYPMANPIGIYSGTRSNGNGVDLMRNAPINARHTKLPLIGGHRLSPKIPWYRGPEGAEMEVEAQVLCDYIQRHCFDSKLSLLLDVHSGFGLHDRIWFPYAYSDALFPEAHKVLALKRLLDHSYPNHVYLLEPQNINYLAHGDLWDYMFFEHRKYQSNEDFSFIPLCLEMGSWRWIRKNPRQLFSSFGIFNPMLPHRLKRVQRRHIGLFDFLLKAINSNHSWAQHNQEQTKSLRRSAMQMWYQKT